MTLKHPGKPRSSSIEETLQALSQREKDILLLRSVGYTYASIAKWQGVSGTRIRQIDRKATRRVQLQLVEIKP